MTYKVCPNPLRQGHLRGFDHLIVSAKPRLYKDFNDLKVKAYAIHEAGVTNDRF
jgi:hypothetical protein